MDTQTPPINSILTPQQQKDREAYLKQQEETRKVQEELDKKKFSIQFTRLQWRVIYNILLSLQYKLGDAEIVKTIVDTIQPIIAVDTNISPKEQGNQPPAPEAAEAPNLTLGVAEEAK